MRSIKVPTFENLKRDLANQILELSDDNFYELVSIIQDGEIKFLKEPSGALSCKLCKQIYGKCFEAENICANDKPKCKDKFFAYHGSCRNGISC